MTHRVVVDDSEDVRVLVSLAFTRDGRLQVLAAVGDGQQGVEAVREHRPDVVVMDVSMPVMDGLAATRAIKGELPDVRVLVLTGYGDERVAAQATDAGADAFLDKSEPLDVMIGAVVGLAERP